MKKWDNNVIYYVYIFEEEMQLMGNFCRSNNCRKSCSDLIKQLIEVLFECLWVLTHIIDDLVGRSNDTYRD